MKKRLILAATAAAAILGAQAQLDSPAPEGYIQRALAMYRDGNYIGCIDQLDHAAGMPLSPAQRQEVDFYRALSTQHTDIMLAARMLETFLQDNPSTPLRNRILFELGNCWYGTDYSRALAYYDQVYDSALDDLEYEDLCYRMAFCCLQLGQTADALTLFDSLQYSPRYAATATFYKGYIAYTQGDYVRALDLLKDVDTSAAPGNMAPFYLSQIYYARGDYQKALNCAETALRIPDLSTDFIAEASRVAGESAYQLGDDQQVGRYLAYYVSLVEEPLPSALYILGLYAYNSGEYPLALKYMAPASTCADAMGQSACLYMGQAYLKLADYQGAVLAFDKAMNMVYDPAVRETAYYNYAVASMEGATVPFGSTVATFSEFLRLFPDSKYAPRVQDYIITSYITDNNYQAALESINAMRQPSAATLAAKQRVLYVLGTKALGAGDNKLALEYLDGADALAAHNAEIAREVKLSRGEALYRAGKYAEAADCARAYLSKAPAQAANIPIAQYDLGYACFAQKKYAEAASAFTKMLAAPGQLASAVKADAYCRLGDSHFATGAYAKAAEAYAQAYKTDPSVGDYALFREALMAGYQRQHTRKLQVLDNMLAHYPASDLVPSALLEKCESYIQLGESGKAVEVYRSLVKDYPGTRQARQGYLQMAVTLLGSGSREQAKEAYRQVISRYPTSEEAALAVDQMKKICAEDGSLQQFMTFVNGVDGAPGMDATELDRLTYETAEKAYIAGDDASRLLSYITDQPDGAYRPKALAYLIEDEYYKGHLAKAAEYAADFVSRYPDHSMAANAYRVKAENEEQQGRGTVALESWKQLARTAPTPELLALARSGIMRCAVDAREWDTAIETADRVLAANGSDTDAYAEAACYMGRALAAKGRAADARAAWEKAAPRTDCLYGIQSAYLLGQSWFDAGNIDKAAHWAETVTKANSPHHYWTARGFILLSDVLKARGESYKAVQYLESLKKNYPGSEADIIQMIDQRL